jgi:hypothetical protein
MEGVQAFSAPFEHLSFAVAYETSSSFRQASPFPHWDLWPFGTEFVGIKSVNLN